MLDGLSVYWEKIDHEVLLFALKNFLAALPTHAASLRAKDRCFTRLGRTSVTSTSRGTGILRTTQTLTFTVVS